MSYEWLAAPHEYEPDYDAYWRDLESLEDAMANVATYDDWFPDDEDTEVVCVNAHDLCYGGAGGPCPYCERPIVAQQQGGDWIDDFESGNAAYAASFAR